MQREVSIERFDAHKGEDWAIMMMANATSGENGQMIFYRGQMMRRVQLRAVRDVGGALPRAAYFSAVVHGAHRPGIHAEDGDDTPVRAWRAHSLALYAVPVFTLYSAIVTPVWNTSITKSTEAEACARRGLATKSAGGGGETTRQSARALPRQHGRATPAPREKAV